MIILTRASHTSASSMITSIEHGKFLGSKSAQNDQNPSESLSKIDKKGPESPDQFLAGHS